MKKKTQPINEQILEYANKFYRKNLEYFNLIADKERLSENAILPIYCSNVPEERRVVMDAYSTGDIRGYFCYHEVDDITKLNKKLKQVIRDDVIGYCLWELGLPLKKNLLIHNCYGYAFDGILHDVMTLQDQRKFATFKRLFNEYVKDLPDRFRPYGFLTLMDGLDKETSAELEESLIKSINALYRIFGK